MTLPFRRRHNDAEDTHVRARSLTSRSFLERLDTEEQAWLASHLEACTECRREREEFAADRELLRTLRDVPIEPPRDLWARTSAALDQAAAKRPLLTARSGPQAAPRGRAGWGAWRGRPVGAAAGVLILVVVLGATLLPGLAPSGPVPSQPVAGATPGPGATPITVAAGSIPNLRTAADGTLEFFFTDVDAVCPRSRPECVPPPPSRHVEVNLLGAKASTVTISPHNDQLVYESVGGTANAGKIVITPVSPTATQSPAPGSNPPSTAPGTEPPGSDEPTPAATPAGQIEIASGVTVVGEVAYSDDGQWLAFSAAPADGSTGPDLYLYSAGSSAAIRVTDDHQTYFSAWLDGKVLASRVTIAVGPANPGASGGTGLGQGPPIDGHPGSFVLDPATLARTELAQADVWLPVVSSGSRFVAFWSGTLRSTDGGVTWQLGNGQVLLDGWTAADGSTPGESGAAPAEPVATGVAVVGPAGHPGPLAQGHVEDFRAQFDPDGIRLAVWVSEHRSDAVGRLHLVVIDAASGAVIAEQLQPGVPSLRRFSIDTNRLAWVSPPGQDGQESSLQVLGWTGDTFGEIQSEPAPELFILR